MLELGNDPYLRLVAPSFDFSLSNRPLFENFVNGSGFRDAHAPTSLHCWRRNCAQNGDD